MDEKHNATVGQGANTTSTAESRAGEAGEKTQGAQATRGPAGGEAGQAQKVQDTVPSRASNAAHRHEPAQDYLHRMGERYPHVRRYYEEGTRAIGHQVSEAPLLSLLAVGAIGFALAWMIQGGQSRSHERTPSRAPMRRDVPGYRSGKPLIESDRVEGTAVYGQNNHRIGTIKRVMIDKISGRVAYAVMSFGGFLGIGSDEYAIPWGKLDYDTSLEGYRTDITEEQLRQAPSFSRQGSYDWSDRDRERELHDHYQVSYYWIVT